MLPVPVPEQEPAPAEKLPRDLKAEAAATPHLLTHTPFNIHCEACRVAKATRRPARRQQHGPAEVPMAFGDLVNADYIVAQSEESMGLTGERDALVIVDRAEPNYMDCYPLMSRTAGDAYGALSEYFGQVVPKRMYTDNAPELIRACKD